MKSVHFLEELLKIFFLKYIFKKILPPNICDPNFCPPNIYDKSTPLTDTSLPIRHIHVNLHSLISYPNQCDVLFPTTIYWRPGSCLSCVCPAFVLCLLRPKSSVCLEGLNVDAITAIAT